LMMFCLRDEVFVLPWPLFNLWKAFRDWTTVLIDRRFSRNLPIQPDYRGRQVDAINNEKVKVSENNGEDVVYLVTTENLI
jgi:hypothetical protein